MDEMINLSYLTLVEWVQNSKKRKHDEEGKKKKDFKFFSSFFVNKISSFEESFLFIYEF